MKLHILFSVLLLAIGTLSHGGDMLQSNAFQSDAIQSYDHLKPSYGWSQTDAIEQDAPHLACMSGPAEEVWGDWGPASILDSGGWVWYDSVSDTLVIPWTTGGNAHCGLQFFDGATLTLQASVETQSVDGGGTIGPERSWHDGKLGQLIVNMLVQNPSTGSVISERVDVWDIATRSIVASTPFALGHSRGVNGDWRFGWGESRRSVESAFDPPAPSTMQSVVYSISGVDILHFGLAPKEGTPVDSYALQVWFDGITTIDGDLMNFAYNQEAQAFLVSVSHWNDVDEEYIAGQVNLVTGNIFTGTTTTVLPPPQSGTRGPQHFLNPNTTAVLQNDGITAWLMDYDVSSANSYVINHGKLWRWNGTIWEQPTEVADFTSGVQNYDPTIYILHDPVTDAVAVIKLYPNGTPTIWIYNAKRCYTDAEVSPFRVSFNYFPSFNTNRAYFNFFDGVISVVTEADQLQGNKVGLLRLMLPGSSRRRMPGIFVAS